MMTKQDTGLKDANGVEVYEGDILWDPHYEVYGVVSFEEDSFRYTDGNVSELLGEVHNVLEVHGNVNQNPELLGDLHAK